MAEYMSMMANCGACDQVFSFNPDLVPSVRVMGEKVPICKECMDSANRIRKQNGLPPLAILPGAYDAQKLGE